MIWRLKLFLVIRANCVALVQKVATSSSRRRCGEKAGALEYVPEADDDEIKSFAVSTYL